MAFSVTSIGGGNRDARHLGYGEVFWLPGDPGVSYVTNSRYSFSGGVLIAATDSLQAPFRPIRNVTCAANTTAFTAPKDLDPAASTQDTTLIPCVIEAIAGVPIVTSTIANYTDIGVTTYSAANRYVESDTSFGADDRPNGGLAYVYEGTGMGEFNVVEDYDHAGGNVAQELIFHRPFSATLDTTSKLIVLGSTAAANAVGLMGRLDLKDLNEADVIDGVGDGNYFVCQGWKELPETLAIGHLRLALSAAIFSE